MIYIHGNQTDYEYGVARGFQFYDNLFVQYKNPRRPVRLVLWLWESERAVARLYDDYLVKSRRAVQMGKTLNKTLDALGNRKVALVGFSLGAQVVLSAMEQLEPDCGCPIAAGKKDKYHVALIAPATDPDYFCSVINRKVQCSIVRSSTVVANSQDRVIKAMRFVIRKRCPEARQGFTTLAQCKRFPLGEPEFFDTAEEMSGQHSIKRYTRSSTTQRAINAVLDRVAAEPF